MSPRVVDIPGLRLCSEANQREHHFAKARRVARQRDLVCMCLRPRVLEYGLRLPLVVRIVRIAPRELDAHDNLGSACKAVADGITDALGLKSDRTPGLSFEYGQERGKPRAYGVRIEVRSVGGE